MEKALAEAVKEGYSGWLEAPQWYLWDTGFLVLGRCVGVVPPHQHHAIEVAIVVEGSAAMAGRDGEWRPGRGIIVRHDVEHSYSVDGYAALIFVDPESIEGQWMRSSLSADITVVPESRLQKCVDVLRTFIQTPLESLEIGAVIRNCVHSLCVGAPPARQLDQRVTRVLQAIRESDDLRISLASVAAQVFLSPGRFAHLFKQQVGVPFRRYILWRKLTRSLLSIARGETTAAAAQAADFADAAHLTRTFYAMFGAPPSAMMRGDFFEINPPWSSGSDRTSTKST
jgi:AraC family transcriptional regulator